MPVNQNLTELFIVLDQSTSMEPLQSKTIEQLNQLLIDQKALPGQMNVSIYQFNRTVAKRYNSVNIHALPYDANGNHFNRQNYSPCGGTALLDAVGEAIDDLGKNLSNRKEEDRPAKILIAIFTDGEENSSHLPLLDSNNGVVLDKNCQTVRRHTLQNLKERITHQQDVYSWNFVFIGAGINAFQDGAALGVHQTYSTPHSNDGIQKTYQSLSRSVSAYRDSSKGAKCFAMEAESASDDKGNLISGAVVTTSVGSMSTPEVWDANLRKWVTGPKETKPEASIVSIKTVDVDTGVTPNTAPVISGPQLAPPNYHTLINTRDAAEIKKWDGGVQANTPLAEAADKLANVPAPLAPSDPGYYSYRPSINVNRGPAPRESQKPIVQPASYGYFATADGIVRQDFSTPVEQPKTYADAFKAATQQVGGDVRSVIEEKPKLVRDSKGRFKSSNNGGGTISNTPSGACNNPLFPSR